MMEKRRDRVTFNLTPEARAALPLLPGRDQTDAINRAIRTVAALRRHVADGCLTVVAVDGSRVEVHIL